MAAFDDVVIISGCRTPVGKFQGSLSDFRAPELGALVVREVVRRAGIDAGGLERGGVEIGVPVYGLYYDRIVGRDAIEFVERKAARIV